MSIIWGMDRGVDDPLEGQHDRMIQTILRVLAALLLICALVLTWRW